MKHRYRIESIGGEWAVRTFLCDDTLEIETDVTVFDHLDDAKRHLHFLRGDNAMPPIGMVTVGEGYYD